VGLWRKRRVGDARRRDASGVALATGAMNAQRSQCLA
jgi:hypothetical protein